MHSAKTGFLTLFLVVVVGVLTLAPAIMLVVGSFSQGLGAFGDFTLEKYVRVYTDPRLYGVLLNTFIFTFGSALIATAMAFGLAYLNFRTDAPFRGLLHLLPILSMMVPHLAFGTSWAMLLNPTNGIFNVFLRDTLGLGVINIYSLAGMVFTEGLLELPVAYLVIAAAMRSFDTALEEASWISGGSSRRTMLKIILPMLQPALLAAVTLVIIRTLGAFAIPSVLGMPARVDVLTTYIYRIVTTGFLPDYGRAAAVGISVLATAIVLVFVYRYYTSAGERFVTIGGRGYKPQRVSLGAWRVPLGLVTLLVGLVLVVIPVLVLAWVSVVPYVMAPSQLAWSMLTSTHWQAVLGDRLTRVAFQNSVFLALAGATIGIVLSTFSSYIIVRLRNRGSVILETLAFTSFAFPGIVLAIGFMWVFVRTGFYGTIWALLISYVATYLPFGIRPLTSTFIQIGKDLEEASFISGAGLIRTLRRVVAPLAMPGIISGWTLMAVMFIRELDLSVILARPGSEVLSVLMYRAVHDALWGKVATIGVIMIVLSTLLIMVTNLVERRFAMTSR
ncbi:MAG TPA: iron ABC transporter permease [Trueperaceae bacterium]|nr:iron ABC transporter permease [Trueperaceae bacterium]